MTKLIIRCGNAIDTTEMDTKAKLMTAIKAGLPDILPETVTVLVNADEELVGRVEQVISVDTLWEIVRDNALRTAGKMLEAGGMMGAERAATIHQLINAARRAEKRLALGPDNCEDTLTMPTATHKSIETSKKGQKAQKKAERETMTTQE